MNDEDLGKDALRSRFERVLALVEVAEPGAAVELLAELTAIEREGRRGGRERFVAGASAAVDLARRWHGGELDGADARVGILRLSLALLRELAMGARRRAKTITLPTGEYEIAKQASLTGQAREAVVAGARVLVVEVEIASPGRFHFYGDLCNAEGEPGGYVQLELELGAGIVEVELPMVTDRAEAAYTVSGLRVVAGR